MGKLFTDDQVYRDFAALTAAADRVVQNLNRGQGTLGKLLNDEAGLPLARRRRSTTWRR